MRIQFAADLEVPARGARAGRTEGAIHAGGTKEPHGNRHDRGTAPDDSGWLEVLGKAAEQPVPLRLPAELVAPPAVAAPQEAVDRHHLHGTGADGSADTGIAEAGIGPGRVSPGDFRSGRSEHDSAPADFARPDAASDARMAEPVDLLGAVTQGSTTGQAGSAGRDAGTAAHRGEMPGLARSGARSEPTAISAAGMPGAPLAHRVPAHASFSAGLLQRQHALCSPAVSGGTDVGAQGGNEALPPTGDTSSATDNGETPLHPGQRASRLTGQPHPAARVAGAAPASARAADPRSNMPGERGGVPAGTPGGKVTGAPEMPAFQAAVASQPEAARTATGLLEADAGARRTASLPERAPSALPEGTAPGPGRPSGRGTDQRNAVAADGQTPSRSLDQKDASAGLRSDTGVAVGHRPATAAIAAVRPGPAGSTEAAVPAAPAVPAALAAHPALLVPVAPGAPARRPKEFAADPGTGPGFVAGTVPQAETDRVGPTIGPAQDQGGLAVALPAALVRADAALVSAAPSAPSFQAADIAQQVLRALPGSPDAPVELVLSPAELGTIRMVMRLEGDSVTLMIRSERADTHDMLRRHSEVLAQELRNSGFSSVSCDFGQGRRNPQPQPQPQPANPLAQTYATMQYPTPATETPRPQHRPNGSGLDLRL